MTGPKTNERPGTKAIHRHARVAPNKVREVLDLVRNKPVAEAMDILRFSERDPAMLVAKVLQSAVANAEHNDQLDPEELFVSACFADEGTTIKRWRPRARGRATRIRKRTSHITVIVSRLPQVQLDRLVAKRRAELLDQRARRVAGARRSGGQEDPTESRATRRRRRGRDNDVQAEDVSTDATDTEVLDTEVIDTEVMDTDDTDTDVTDTGVTDTDVTDTGVTDTDDTDTEAEAEEAAPQVAPTTSAADEESE
jgi:large subunit ribosomal protein L22